LCDARRCNDLEHLTLRRVLLKDHELRKKNTSTTKPTRAAFTIGADRLCTVDGNIQKIAPYLEFQTKQEANAVAMAALQYCTIQLGEPSSQTTGMFICDTLDGNVILQTADTAEGLAVYLFITSKNVAQFARL
jgi:hypothetical protein